MIEKSRGDATEQRWIVLIAVMPLVICGLVAKEWGGREVPTEIASITRLVVSSLFEDIESSLTRVTFDGIDVSRLVDAQVPGKRPNDLLCIEIKCDVVNSSQRHVRVKVSLNGVWNQTAFLLIDVVGKSSFVIRSSHSMWS